MVTRRQCLSRRSRCQQVVKTHEGQAESWLRSGRRANADAHVVNAFIGADDDVAALVNGVGEADDGHGVHGGEDSGAGNRQIY